MFDSSFSKPLFCKMILSLKNQVNYLNHRLIDSRFFVFFKCELFSLINIKMLFVESDRSIDLNKKKMRNKKYKKQ